MRTVVILLLGLLAVAARAEDFPRVVVDRDDVAVTASSVIVIAPGAVIADANGDGVIHVAADHVTLRFAEGAVLRGAAEGTPGDRLAGTGISIAGRKGVVIEGARVEGFKRGLVATAADGLVIAGGELRRLWRQRLRSTPTREHGGDWLFPHGNDREKWRDQYGGAACVESSRRVVIRDLVVRESQNGIVLDRVRDAAVFDSDCSFLSGWGLALWRCERVLVSRNAFDFCVRGHVEGVYNRGQDSAGLLLFEQSNENVIVECSITHGGDGLFAFAGREAIGEEWLEAERERLRRESGKADVDDQVRIPLEVAQRHARLGCNRNLILGNDLSYAAAHGLELTFSEDNHVVENRLVENAICGVWGGYSSDTWFVRNRFARNGGMAYGLERGAIDCEHAAGLVILENELENDRVGVHLWWDVDAGLRRMPGALHDRPVAGNVIAHNVFRLGDGRAFARMAPDEKMFALELRDAGKGMVRDNRFLGNSIQGIGERAEPFSVTPGAEPLTEGKVPAWSYPADLWRWPADHPGLLRGEDEPPPASKVPHPVRGKRRPVGAREALAGRGAIVMGEWGPWDHQGPLLRELPAPRGRAWELIGVARLEPPEVLAGEVDVAIARSDATPPVHTVRLFPRKPGLTAFRVRLRGPGFERELAGSTLSVRWEVSAFPWVVDPRKNLEAWREESRGPDARQATLESLALDFGGGGPRDLGMSDAIRREGPGPDRFGIVARTRLPLPAGKYRFRTTSDDGVRVLAGGKTLIERWDQHGPTEDEATLEHAGGEVEVVVEHFELDGWSVLRVELEPAP